MEREASTAAGLEMRINGLVSLTVRHWLALFVVLYGVLVWLPFSAPFLMRSGATSAADAVYFIYSFLCHQLPERSIFLFGPKLMYSFADIKAVWPLDGFQGLRQFVGNPEMGYKVAWSDRMISTYGGIWLGAVAFALLGRRSPRIPWKLWLIIGVLPLGIDGVSHMLNDVLAGTTGLGFRDTNAWLQALTFNAFPSSFYAGDQLGSFNSTTRWITGLLFGVISVLAVFPFVERAVRELAGAATPPR